MTVPTGRQAASRPDIVVSDPAIGEIIGRAPDLTAEIPSLAARSRTAQPAWAARSFEDRGRVLAAMRRWLVHNRAAVLESSVRETGKTYEDALNNEVLRWRRRSGSGATYGLLNSGQICMSVERVYLSSSVYTRDRAKAAAIARRLGNTAINDGLINFLGRAAPVGGSKESGIGARHGRDGIVKFTEPHTIMTARFAPRRDPAWLPASPRTTRLAERLLARCYGR